jgi:hypothetical protein
MDYLLRARCCPLLGGCEGEDKLKPMDSDPSIGINWGLEAGPQLLWIFLAAVSLLRTLHRTGPYEDV